MAANSRPKDSLTATLKYLRRNRTQVNKIRWVIEQAIAHVKTRILHTDYRSPIDAFPQVIKAVIGLEFFRIF